MDNKPKYITVSAMGSFIVPIAMMVWFIFSYDFINPDGTPDNAPIRSIPAVFIFSIFIFIFQLFAYAALGNSIYKQKLPNIKPGVVYATVLSMPITVIIYFMVITTNQSEPQSKLLAISIALQFFCFFWGSFITGALVQLWLVKKHNKSLQHQSLRSLDSF